MKRLLLSLFALLLASTSFAQDTLHVGVPIYYNQNGSISIGNTDYPPLFLNRNGNGTHTIFQRSGSNRGYVGTGNSGTSFYLTSYSDLGFRVNNSAAEAMYIKSNGDVGIGTNTPYGNLEISDSGDSKLQITSTGNYGNAELSFLNSHDNYGFKQFLWNGGDQLHFNYGAEFNGGVNPTTNIMTMHGSGKIGIGTGSTAPAEKLEIKGNLLVDASVGGGLFLNANDGVNIDFRFREAGVNKYNLGYIAANDAMTLYDNTAGAYRWYVASDGKMGVGTSSPASRLHVHDNTGQKHRGLILSGNWTSSGTHYNLMSFKATDALNSDAFLDTSSEGTKNFHIGLVSDNGYFNQDRFSIIQGGVERLVVDGYNNPGNVGIGTASPNARLDVRSDGSVTQGAELRLQHANANTNDIVSTVNFANNAGSVAKIESGTVGGNNNGYISMFTDNAGASSERMRITHDGNVGIGTSSPTEKLHVDGSIRLGTEVAPRWANSLSGYVLQSSHFYGHSSTETISLGESGNRISIRGKIGVGTTNPSGNLDVVGDTYHKGRIFFTDPSAVDPTSGTEYAYFWIDDTSKDLKLNSYGSAWGTSVTFKKDGNVGIGTTAPTERLEVDGNTLVQGNIESKRVKVTETPGNWPDYVFEKNYQLRDINEVEAFIKKNKHLPEVPSAKEVEEKGIDVANMDATLLKKVEELTLYLIELDKKVKRLEEENKELKQAVKGKKG